MAAQGGHRQAKPPEQPVLHPKLGQSCKHSLLRLFSPASLLTSSASSRGRAPGLQQPEHLQGSRSPHLLPSTTCPLKRARCLPLPIPGPYPEGQGGLMCLSQAHTENPVGAPAPTHPMMMVRTNICWAPIHVALNWPLHQTSPLQGDVCKSYGGPSTN